jgi:hypothetical protein
MLAALHARHVHPTLAVKRLRCGIARPFVPDVLVLAGEDAIIAIFTLRDIDYHVPLLHASTS